MERKRRGALVAASAVVALVATACGGSSSGGGNSANGKTAQVAFNAGSNAVVNASTQTGGTLHYVLSDAPDSMDPGDTYYAFMWNFARLYARPLTTFKPAPGTDGLKLVPDLATSLGKPSADGKTWTYTLKQGIKFEDGSPVTAKDVKYAIARSNYTAELVEGPKYFAQYLDAGGYKGPYKDKNLDHFKGITTPDDHTLVFHLTQPFTDFDFLVSNPQSAPVPAAKDTGLKYQEHPVSTGPYMFKSHQVGKSFVLVKNPNWSSSTDSTRKQLVNEIDGQFKVDANDIDQRLQAGTADVDMGGTGVQAQSRATILTSPNKKANADNPQTGFLRYAMISTKVAPFTNIDCRKAVLYAADHQAIQSAFGGPVGGDIATTAIPPTVLGYQKADAYNFLQNPNGNVQQAKQELAKCGKPSGFSTKIALRGDRPKEVAAGEALQQALSKVGIKTTIAKYPSGDWSGQYGGNPTFVHAHGIGIMIAGWGADWPSGFGFLSQIADGRAIKPNGGNYNQMELNDPSINALLDQSMQTKDVSGRIPLWAQVDQKIMASGALLPFTYEKSVLYRPPSLTNVYVTKAYGMYDYTALGKM